MLKSPPPLLTKISENTQSFITDGNILDIKDNNKYYTFVIKNNKVVGILVDVDKDHMEILNKYKIPY
jgi:hypothetical protein